MGVTVKHEIDRILVLVEDKVVLELTQDEAMYMAQDLLNEAGKIHE